LNKVRIVSGLSDFDQVKHDILFYTKAKCVIKVIGVGELDQLQQGYRDNIDALRAASDAEFGIVSRRVMTSEGDTWSRDATRAYALGDPKRPPHDAAMIEANNTLLRMLARLRPIDYMLSKHEDEFLDDNKRQELRNNLKSMFEAEKIRILDRAEDLPLEKNARTTKAMHKIEKEFNTFLIKTLHKANLTKGCSTQHDAEALLSHYKILYSVLDPAMPLVTLTYDKDAGILQRETQYPVTEKTEFQKGYEDTLKTVIPYPVGAEVNAHTEHNEAEQLADKCFADLLVADDRMLTSQARKSHLVGVKNAFIVKVETQGCAYGFELERDKEEIEDPAPLWLGRMGVPVYVGPGEKYTNAHVKANLEQLQHAAKKYMRKHDRELNIHLTTLNTDTSIDGEKQDVMIDGLHKAMKGTTHDISVVPTNDMGMLYTPQVADPIKLLMEKEGKAQPGQKADRLDLAVDVVLKAKGQDNTISFVNCASGIDRTGTVIEAAIQQHTVTKLEADKSAVENMRARGFNSAEMTHHMVPGTPGMKPCSQANNWFGWGRKTFNDLVGGEFYLKTALLNKKNKVKNVECLKRPSTLLFDEFTRNEQKLKQLLLSVSESNKTDHLCADMIKAAKKILVKASNRSAFKTKDYEQINQVYVLVSHVLEQAGTTPMNAKSLNDVGLGLKRINNIMQELPNARSLKKKIQNFVFTTVVVLATAALLTVPWFNAIFVVASALVMLSSAKVGATLGIYGVLAKKALVFSLPGADELLADPSVRDKTKSFTQAGQTFFDQHNKTLQDKLKPDPDAELDHDVIPNKI
tara:strand:- start:76953 stop:79364 length:2412 start_codon:yes stop_codon:yes gene_type:complete